MPAVACWDRTHNNRSNHCRPGNRHHFRTCPAERHPRCLRCPHCLRYRSCRRCRSRHLLRRSRRCRRSRSHRRRRFEPLKSARSARRTRPRATANKTEPSSPRARRSSSLLGTQRHGKPRLRCRTVHPADTVRHGLAESKGDSEWHAACEGALPCDRLHHPGSRSRGSSSRARLRCSQVAEQRAASIC